MDDLRQGKCRGLAPRTFETTPTSLSNLASLFKGLRPEVTFNERGEIPQERRHRSSDTAFQPREKRAFVDPALKKSLKVSANIRAIDGHRYLYTKACGLPSVDC